MDTYRFQFGNLSKQRAVGHLKMPIEAVLIDRGSELYQYFNHTLKSICGEPELWVGRALADYAFVTLDSISFAYSTMPCTGE